MSFTKRDLTKKSEDVSEWYTRVVALAELADYGPVKGTMIIRPYGYAIWELIQKDFDRRIKENGVENAYFPLFIPESLLKKEAAHVEGFSPELAVVTIAGGEELGEKVVVRPTSETIMYQTFADWVQSWRDLPLKVNQWCNVVRWEKRTYPFLRTSEFLWQEGHTAHATHEEAYETVLWAINEYADLYRDVFALPGYVGRKSASERFAGADDTLTYELLMPGGKVLQSCTSHDLGQNFSKAFGITFQDQESKGQHVWQTSWGLSTRSIGALILAHGDDNGLKLPPRLAPVQVVVLPIRGADTASVKDLVRPLSHAGIRVKVDEADHESLGSRINTWELKGVPLRMEIGPRELEEGTVTLVRRDSGEKMQVAHADLAQRIAEILDDIQTNMLCEAEDFLKENTREAIDYSAFKAILAGPRGFIRAFWCEDPACEAAIKEETKATTRCLPLDAPEERGTCVRCGGEAKRRWLFGQAY
jgi:prolyl-tRNA synthetase